MRRLTKDEHLSHEFATTWPQYDLDQKTHALLAYAKKLTQEPSMMEDSDVEAYEKPDGMSKGSTKPRLSSPCSTSWSAGSRFGAADGSDTGRSAVSRSDPG